MPRPRTVISPPPHPAARPASRLLLGALTALALSLGAWPSGPAAQAKELDIHYLGNYPSDKGGEWTSKLQGIANDDEAWFLTQLDTIWRVPLDVDFAHTKKMPARVTHLKMPEELKKAGYDHFGDPDVFETYLFVPVEGKSVLAPLIAVFEIQGRDLKYVNYFPLARYQRSGWCAISPDGQLYTSNNIIDRDSPIVKYDVYWDLLTTTGRLELAFAGDYELTGIPDEFGGNVSKYIQGGDFSTDGQYLFLSNGKVQGLSGTRERTHDKGIWVFSNDAGKWGNFVTKSAQKGDFRFEYKPFVGEEPEGLTYWDLQANSGAYTGPRGPGLDGQLHVILLNRGASVWIKHYSVDR